MPIYEYRCHDCGKKFSSLTTKYAGSGPERCVHCGSRHIKRIMSSFNTYRSESSRLADYDPAETQGEDFYRDPRNIGLRTKKRLKAVGADAVLEKRVDDIIEKGRTGKILDDYLE
ncbi:MAG: FmdB family zinc ribbon protein [Desulfocucumaceae bacterium]